MEDYVLKVAHSNAEVADRAVNTIHSKLSAKLVRIDDILSIHSGVFCGHLLHWINERQTQADSHLLACSLKMLKLSADTPAGRRSLKDFGGIEFLSAYHRHAPAPLQDLISEVLNALVTAIDRDEDVREPSMEGSLLTFSEERLAATFEPRTIVTDPVTTKLFVSSRVDSAAHPRVDQHCEYPPVLLSESDEKVLFDLTVSIKFGDAEQAIEALEQVARGVMLDFPVDSLLQRADLVRAIAALSARAGEKEVLLVGEKCIATLEQVVRKVAAFEGKMRLPDFRPAQNLPRKLLVAAEFTDNSHPCLSIEAWENGTPGNTLSVPGLMELVLTSIPLHEPRLLGACKRLWKAAEAFLERLAKHPFAVQSIVKRFSSALEVLDKGESAGGSGFFLHRLALAQMLIPLIKALPIDTLKDYIPANSTAGRCLTEFMVFRTSPDEDLLPYLQELDPEGITDYTTAVACVQALAKAQKVKESLAGSKGLPVTSVAMYYNTLTVFQSVLAALEFDAAIPLAPAVIDLNCYSLVIAEDSHLDSKAEEAQTLLLALLTCPLPAVRSSVHSCLLLALRDDRELGGIGRGSKRNLTTAQALVQKRVLFHLLCMGEFDQRFEVLTEIQQMLGGRALEPLLAFVIGASGHSAKAATLLHLVMTEVSDDHSVFWKSVKDLFSIDAVRRRSALATLGNRSSVKRIAADAQSEEMEMPGEQEDFLARLEEKGDIDFVELPSTPIVLSDFTKLLPFLQSQTIEMTLKNSVMEQIVAFLLIGVPDLKSDHTNPLIAACVQTLSFDITGGAPVINRKLASKSLQILCILACNYQATAKKVYELTPEIALNIVKMTSNAFSPIRFYAYYLLFVLSFSVDVPRNKVETPPGVVYVLSDSKRASGRLRGVPSYSSLLKAFKCPFPITPLTFQYDPKVSPQLQYWAHLPSSSRVHAYVHDEFSFDFHPALEMNKLAAIISSAEQHGHILDAVDSWVNWVLIAPNEDVAGELVRTDSGFFAGLLGVLRVPPTSRVEDALISTITTRITTVVKAVKAGAGKGLIFDFCAEVSDVLQKSLLPLLIESSSLETREPLVCSVIELMNALLPLHDSKLDHSELKTIKVISKFQLDSTSSAKASVLHLLARIAEVCTTPAVLSCVLEAVYRILGKSQLALALDIGTSPGSQELVGFVLGSCVEHVTPFTSPTSFVHKGVLKQIMRVCGLVPHLVPSDSYQWCLKLTRDREAEIRSLSWFLLRKFLPKSIKSHPSLLEESLVVSFAEPDTFGTKTHSLAFLSEVANLFADTEASSETQQFLSTLYQQGVLSHLKSLLFESAGPSCSYFAALITLLNGLLVLDSEKVIAVCNQLDLWDGIMRLIRPGAMRERSNNEKRSPFLGESAPQPDAELVAVTLFFNFISQTMLRDAQTCAFLLESTHVLSYTLQWLNDLQSSFESSKEQTYGKAITAVLNCLHCALFVGKGKGARVVCEELEYSVVSDLMDKLSGTEVRMAATRVLTSLLPLATPGDEGERLILHQVGTFKTALSENSPPDIRDSLGCLVSLLYHSEVARRVALATGFDKDLAEYADRLAAALHAEELARTKPKYLRSQSVAPEQGDLLQVLLIIRTWASGPADLKSSLSFRSDGLGPLFTSLFSLWTLAQRHPPIFESLLQTISTAIASSDEAKKACVILQESKQSILSLIIDYACRPAQVSEEMYLLALKVVGNIAGNKEARQLIIKSKFAFGLAQRLVKVWNECKDPTVLPPKTKGTVSFLSTFSFYKEGQIMITTVTGLIDVLIEVLERYTNDVTSAELVEDVLILMRNLGFQQATKPHIFTKPQALPLVLSLASAPGEKPSIRKLAAATLWSVLYANQKVKGILTRSEALENLRLLYQELTREIEAMQRAAKDPGKDLIDLKETALAIDSVIKICASG